MRWTGLCGMGLASAALAGCVTDPGKDGPACNSDDLYACYPELDKQVDGEPEDEKFVSDEVDTCVTADGRIYTVWIDDRKEFHDVWFNRSADGGKTWLTAPVQIRSGNGDASGVDLDCVGDTVVVAWEDTRDSETDYPNIYLNFSIDGGDTWQDKDVRLDDDPDGRSISLGPQVVVRRNTETRTDRVYVAWFDQLEGAPAVYAVAADITGAGLDTGDRKPYALSDDPENPGAYWSGNPRVAVGGSGKVHVSWEDKRNGTQDIFYAGSNPAGTEYGEQQRLTVGEKAGEFYGFSPDICADGPNVYVVWHDTRGGDARDIFLQYSGDAGQTWFRAAQRVETDAAGSAESFNAKIACSGDVGHVVWQDNRDGAYDIYYRRIAGGKTGPEEGEAEVRIDNGDPKGANISEHPVVSLRDGVLIVGWSDRRAAGEQALTDLYYNYRTLTETGEVGQDFADREDFRLDSIDPGTKYAEALHLASWTDASGDEPTTEVYATWIDNRDGDGDKDIYFSRSFLGEGVTTYEEIRAEQGGAAK